MFDGFEKRPMSALRVIPRHCGVPEVRLIPRASQALTSNVFRSRHAFNETKKNGAFPSKRAA
jgi:hypothetical protein